MSQVLSDQEQKKYLDQVYGEIKHAADLALEQNTDHLRIANADVEEIRQLYEDQAIYSAQVDEYLKNRLKISVTRAAVAEMKRDIAQIIVGALEDVYATHIDPEVFGDAAGDL